VSKGSDRIDMNLDIQKLIQKQLSIQQLRATLPQTSRACPFETAKEGEFSPKTSAKKMIRLKMKFLIPFYWKVVMQFIIKVRSKTSSTP
jgi:hypothetical protein